MLSIIAIGILVIISLFINDILDKEIEKGNGIAEITRLILAIIGAVTIVKFY